MLGLLFGFYIFFPILSIPILGVLLFVDRKHSKWFIFALCLSMALLAYSMEPQPQDDLSRHFMLLNKMSEGGLNFVLKSSEYKTNIVSNFLYYIVALTGKYHLLPAVTVFFSYFLILYVTFSIANANKIESKFVFISLCLFLSLWFFRWSISGVRTILAFAICFFAVYIDLLNKKGLCLKTVLIYFIAVMVHTSAVAVLALRLITLCGQNLKLSKFYGMIMFWPLTLPIIKVILKLSPKNLFFQTLSEKITIYTRNNIASRGVFFLLFISAIPVVILTSIFLIRKFAPQSYDKKQKFYQFLICTCYFTLGSIAFYNIIDRFSVLCGLFGIIVLQDLFQTKAYSKTKNFLYAVIFCFSLVWALLQFAELRGNWRFTESAFSTILGNFYTVFFQ